MRILFALSALFLSFVSFAQEFKDDRFVDISVGTWFLSWEQNDKADTGAVREPINHKFRIEDSLAREISLSGQWKYVKLGINYVFTEGKKVANRKSKADRLMAMLGLKWGDYMDTTFTYIKSSTSGNAEGYDTKTGNTSYIEFDTDLTIMNLTFYPGWIFGKYIGIGTEFMSYDLPQSFYITNNGNVIFRGVEPQMEWEAKFFTLEITNLNKIRREKGLNIFFFLSGGYAYDVNVTGRTAIEPSGYGNLLKGKSGYFYRGDLGLLYRFGYRFFGGLMLGYRYSKYVLETEDTSEGINIYARAESTFQGPYLKILLMF